MEKWQCKEQTLNCCASCPKSGTGAGSPVTRLTGLLDLALASKPSYLFFDNFPRTTYH